MLAHLLGLKEKLRLTTAGYHLFCSFTDFRLGHDFFPQYITGRHECDIIVFDQSNYQQEYRASAMAHLALKVPYIVSSVIL